MTHAALTAEAHRDLRVRADRGTDYGDAIQAALIVPDEFRRLQDAYPILFRQAADMSGFTALALLGFEVGENLFLEGDRWDARVLPLSIDIQPFLIGRAAPDVETAQVHVDLASPRIADDEGSRVFDEDGRPTPFLETIAEKLGALDAGWKGAAGFFAALRRHDLLEPFTLEVTLADGSVNRLVGFHTVDEARLRALDGAALGDLHAEGHLLPVFMAIASLGRIGELVERKNRRATHG